MGYTELLLINTLKGALTCGVAGGVPSCPRGSRGLCCSDAGGVYLELPVRNIRNTTSDTTKIAVTSPARQFFLLPIYVRPYIIFVVELITLCKDPKVHDDI